MSSPRIGALAGVRAIAIILVLFRHGIDALETKFDIDQTSTLVVFLSNGWSGVDLFFVLSGFLIGYHLLLRWPANSADLSKFLKVYAKKRALRILPVYFAGIALAVALPSHVFSLASTDISYDLVVHGLFLQDYLYSNFIVSLWSLATEVKFYMIAPFLLLIFRKSRVSYLVSAVVLTIGVIIYSQVNTLLNTEWLTSYSDFFWVLRAPFHFAVGGLLLGLCVARLYLNDSIPGWVKNHGNRLSYSVIFLLIAGLSYTPMMTDGAQWIVSIVAIPVISLLFCALLIGAIYSKGRLNSLYGSKLSRFISKISYPLYVVHMLVIPLSIEWASSIIEFSVIYLTLSITLGYLMHLLIERPFLTFKESL